METRTSIAELELGQECSVGQERSAAPKPRIPQVLTRAFQATGTGLSWIFGVISLVIGLSLLSALPLAQFLSLGYFLESSGRVARSGRWRDGLIGVRKAARMGGVVGGIWLSSLPLWLIRSYRYSAELVDPGGAVSSRWGICLWVASCLTFLHWLAACGRGGHLGHFLWPIGSVAWWVRLRAGRKLYVESRDRFWDFLVGLRLPHYFRVGVVGFLGTFLWLVIPAALISLGGRLPLVGFVGCVLLAIVVPILPFLQVGYAVEDRWRALFDTRGVRGRFRRAPWAFAVALMSLLLASIPLYLLKIEMVPREAAWLPSLVFVVFLGPARILTGWAYCRSEKRTQPRHWFFRTVGRVAIIPVSVLYVLVVLLAQYTSWGGASSLFEQHAFLIPVPFLGD